MELLIMKKIVTTNATTILGYNNDIQSIILKLCTRKHQIIRIQNYAEEVIPSYSISTFKSHFRMTPTAFEAILSHLANCEVFLKRAPEFGGRKQVDTTKTLLIAIWTLVTPESYRSVGDRFDVTKSTVFFCIKQVVTALLGELCRRTIKFPAIEEQDEASINFRNYGLVGCVGAIDGCHIPIKAPTESPNDYLNRKKFHSVVLQGVCDGNMFFIDCDVRWPGSVHDARVLRTSDLYEDAPTIFARDKYLIGDAAYPCLPWLLPPYKNNGHLTEIQLHFNNCLSKTRVVIERTFALLKGRFRRLKYLEMYNMPDINATIIACCVLHNLCLTNDSDVEDYIRDAADEINIAGLPAQGGNDNEGLLLRQRIAEDLWQMQH